jgi:hypothetical protein
MPTGLLPAGVPWRNTGRNPADYRVAMPLTQEALTDGNLANVVAFFRNSNPFAQKTWGWDTGRFVDWRWSVNVLNEAANPGWFSQHCRIFRDEATLRAVSVAEYGGPDTCIITRTEDAESVHQVLGFLQERRRDLGIGLRFECSDAAEWLREIFGGSGLVETPNTGFEWEYDLTDLPDHPMPVPDGFTIESLRDARQGDLDGIAMCIKAAFDVDYDVPTALRSLEHSPMFKPELSVLARSKDGRIAAYCRGTVDPRTGVCGIDPVCSHPDFQRMGLSKAVVQHCFATQRRFGGRFCYIGSAPDPAPGNYLYQSLGPSSRTVGCEWSDASA